MMSAFWDRDDGHRTFRYGPRLGFLFDAFGGCPNHPWPPHIHSGPERVLWYVFESGCRCVTGCLFYVSWYWLNVEWSHAWEVPLIARFHPRYVGEEGCGGRTQGHASSGDIDPGAS